MINMSTPSDVLLKEMDADIEKIKWWYAKRRGKINGNKHRAKADEYRKTWTKIQKPFIGETFEYKSQNGNRWFVYDVVAVDPSVSGIYNMDKFIYWETYGSIGCFHPTWDRENGELFEGCIIYTPHFFQRYAERLGIPYKSRDLIREFISDSFFRPYQKDTDKDGNEIYVFRSRKCGFCYAVRRQDNPHVYEVRTFLSDNNMSPTKLKRYQDLAEEVDDNDFYEYSLYDSMYSSALMEGEKSVINDL